ARGLPPAAVFSLARPAAAPAELPLLARRYLDAFPAARAALCDLDEVLVGAAAYANRRKDALTAGNPLARWHMLAPTEPGTIARTDAAVGALLPLQDFGADLREGLLAHPDRALRRLAGEDPPPPPGSPRARLAAAPYPWGYPPPW